MPRWTRLLAVFSTAALLVLAFTASSAIAPSGRDQAQAFGAPQRPVGIVSADPEEQAAILAEMRVSHWTDIAGYRYYVGTMDGQPVVDVASGELDETAELAAWLLDTTFHPRATLFSGTAGAQNAGINVGDVVLSGYVADKSQIHYQLGGYQSAYSGIELHVTPNSDVAGAVIDSYGNVYPTPSDAAGFDNNPDPTDTHWIFVDALAATQELVSIARNAPTGTTTLSDATGNSGAQGSFANKVVVGTIGQADVWTEPLSWIEAQNMLFQTDAEENEGSGFAFANAEAGVPWMLVRGISDTPWFPNAYDADLASNRAAAVVSYLVGRLPASVDSAPITMSDLSPIANARQAGYLVANQAYFGVTPVTQVVYSNAQGAQVTLTGSSLAKLTSQYTYAAAHP
jgi:adenosylhomocysteine nucleosidase